MYKEFLSNIIISFKKVGHNELCIPITCIAYDSGSIYLNCSHSFVSWYQPTSAIFTNIKAALLSLIAIVNSREKQKKKETNFKVLHALL